MSISVAIVEDNAGICEELQRIVASQPDFTCLGGCRNAESALQKIPVWAPDVVVMDIQLPDGSGIACTANLKRQLPDTQFLMFTIHDDTEQIVKALESGASGYLLKDTPPAQIVSAIRDVRSHGAPLSREVAHRLVASFHKPAPATEMLTPRENEILTLLAEGLLYKEIGERLEIKLDTVGTHVKSIYRKLHVRTRTEAVVKFLG
jgi:DNA-binding NarL/FixJ family response regulator